MRQHEARLDLAQTFGSISFTTQTSPASPSHYYSAFLAVDITSQHLCASSNFPVAHCDNCFSTLGAKPTIPRVCGVLERVEPNLEGADKSDRVFSRTHPSVTLTRSHAETELAEETRPSDGRWLVCGVSLELKTGDTVTERVHSLLVLKASA